MSELNNFSAAIFFVEFPDFNFKVKIEQNKKWIFDIIRKKYILIQPEEWVRQHLLHYFIFIKNYPSAFIAVEQSIQLNGMSRRCDIVVYNQKFQPMMIVECKAQNINLTQKVFDQAGNYNLALKVPYLSISNGISNSLAKLDLYHQQFEFLKEYPSWEALNI